MEKKAQEKGLIRNAALVSKLGKNRVSEKRKKDDCRVWRWRAMRVEGSSEKEKKRNPKRRGQKCTGAARSIPEKTPKNLGKAVKSLLGKKSTSKELRQADLP